MDQVEQAVLMLANIRKDTVEAIHRLHDEALIFRKFVILNPNWKMASGGQGRGTKIVVGDAYHERTNQINIIKKIARHLASILGNNIERAKEGSD
jgi:hypothetical protein